MNITRTLDIAPVDDLLRRLRRHLAVVPMSKVNRAFNHARDDLRDVGLLRDGRYLDRIECCRMPLPSRDGESGYVYDESVPWYLRLVDVRPGVIYLPRNAPVTAARGDTLVDTIRHEFGHAWAWLDRPFIERRWFRDAFGGRYGEVWDEAPAFDPDEYVSEYACTRPAEDFCETFMTWLRCRRSLHRFDRRPGVARKLDAVASAVSLAASTRMPRVRGPG
jgi:hypothetical protein